MKKRLMKKRNIDYRAMYDNSCGCGVCGLYRTRKECDDCRAQIEDENPEWNGKCAYQEMSKLYSLGGIGFDND